MRLYGLYVMPACEELEKKLRKITEVHERLHTPRDPLSDVDCLWFELNEGKNLSGPPAT